MNTLKILIVEDSELTANVTKQMLKRLGYEVIAVFPSAEEVLEKIDIADIDVLLTDIDLAGQIDGIELARRIHQNSDIPVVFLTNYAERVSEIQSFPCLKKSTLTMESLQKALFDLPRKN